MRIDSHHHFWKYTAAEYGWISDAMSPLRRDFLPPHLAREIASCGIGGVVSVQARQTLEETEFLLGHAERNEFIRGVVGWVPMRDPNVAAILERFRGQPKFKGVRHIIQDEPDDNYILGNEFNRGVAALRDTGLVYDILIYEKHLPQAIRFVDRHPNQVFVLDHVAKPRIKDRVIEPWAANIREMAKRQNVYCKVSGMVTEADWKTWTLAGLAPYLDTVLEAFGPRRLMFGSDWPVCLAASSYQLWYDVLTTHLSGLSGPELDRIFGGTATEAYKL